MSLVLRLFLALSVFVFAPSALADDLTVDRLVASPSLNGPSVAGLKLSPDGARITYLKGKDEDFRTQDLWEFNIAAGEHRLLVDSALLLPGGEELTEVEIARRNRQRIFAHGIVEYYWSPDGRALLFPLGGDLYYLPLRGEPRRLTETEAFETDIRFSPGGRYVSYVREQTLFILEISSGEERQVSPQGAGTISYGVADFAAQEEMYRTTGYWWSPDDSHMAYTRIDESPVQLVDRYEINEDGVRTVPQRYPFAGTDNALINLYIVDLATDETLEVDMGENRDIYLARVNWTPDGSTMAWQRQSRDQKTLELIFVDVETGASRLILTESDPNWVNLNSDLTFLEGGEEFIWTSERTGYRHIYIYGADGSLKRQLTGGDWPLTEQGRGGGAIRGVDEEAGWIFFEAHRASLIEKHLYRVAIDGSGQVQRLTREPGWHSTSFSADASIFIDSWSSADTPPRAVLKRQNGDIITMIEANALDENHPFYPYLADAPVREFGTLEAADGQDLQYFIMRPADFDPEKQYPAIVHVYGGPGVSRQVRNVWKLDVDLLLAQAGYIVFSIDNRGTPLQGKAFENSLYKKMGGPEVEDQVLGARFLQSLSYVDGDRIGVWGWSYGGFMTLHLMFRAADIFKAGFAGAPVVDWRLYDTHYTERYLGDPGDGGDVYKKTSPISYVDGLKGKLMLIHGMADDNVSFANSVQLYAALQKARLPYVSVTYPGKRHRITGEDEQAHLWQTLLDFFDASL